MENWRDIKGYEGMYQVSNYGRIKSLNYNHTKKEKILKGIIDENGYLKVGLSKGGKLDCKRIHRLVAEAFLENPNNLPQVNHKDECKTNNHVENLEWCDAKHNINYGSRNKKCAEKLSRRIDQIDKVTGEVIRQWESTVECGRNGFDFSNVAKCARGVVKQYKGYIWKYIRM